MSTTYRIEPLTEDAIEATARCHAECWVEAYADIVPSDYLARMTDLPTRIEKWWGRFQAGRGTIFIVRGDCGDVVGIAHAGPPRDDESEMPPLELYTLYVRQSQYGTGLAQELIDRAVGSQPAFLWVFEENSRARRFYEKNGFTPTGVWKYDGDTGVREITMVRAG
jgi:RimJ/RimL family protein N-acetyltransferase